MAISRVTDMARIAPLFEEWPVYLFRTVLDGEMGEAWANESGTAAVLYLPEFSFLAGDAACADAEALAAFAPEGDAADMRFWAPRDEAWAGVIERALGARVRRTQRYGLRKDVHHFDEQRLRALAATLPEGCSLRAIDGPLYRQALTETWSCDLVVRFRDEKDFLARGLGVVAMRGDEMLSGASSFVVFRGGIEVEIDTRRDQRRRGLAAACGAQLLLNCFARGIYPSWDAHNPASVALAEKLGYVAGRPYPVYETQKKPDGTPA